MVWKSIGRIVVPLYPWISLLSRQRALNLKAFWFCRSVSLIFLSVFLLAAKLLKAESRSFAPDKCRHMLTT